MSSFYAFPWIGGKVSYADWIVDYIPDHRAYVEPFGGAATVLFSKEPSKIEVYNDRNRDVVHFFRVLRERRDELDEWLRLTPYSRDVHERWSRAYFDGERPDDDVERAGRFFYLRFTQFNSKIGSKSGFKYGKHRNEANKYADGIERLDKIVDRLGGSSRVTIECLDWKEVVETYDHEDTFFYFDPPYVDKGVYYSSADFDHDDFVDLLDDISGDWIVSYGELPAALENTDYRVVSKETSYPSTTTRPGESRKDATERLVMNFPPSTDSFSSKDQTGLGDF